MAKREEVKRAMDSNIAAFYGLRKRGVVLPHPAGLAGALGLSQRLIPFRLAEIGSHIRRTISVNHRQKER